jgi:hypothetical protein
MHWIDLLAAERARLFVGREEELAQVDAFLDGPLRLLYVSGPAGVGKTALLHELERIARAHDRRVRRLDGASLSTTPADLALAMRGDADLIVIDEFDRVGPLHGWIRDVVLPQLPTSTRVVVAGRMPPSEAWLADSGWRPLLRWIPLRNLARPAAIDYLVRRGATRARAEELARTAHGHPLCLSVLGDLIDGNPALRPEDATSTIEATIRRVLVESTPAAKRRVLEAAAVAAFVDEPLLHAMLGDEAAGGIDWLASRPFIDATDRGLRLHETAADAIVADLRWRDPARVRFLRQAALRHHAHYVRHECRSIAEAEALFWRVIRILAHEPATRFLKLLPESSALYRDVAREPDREVFLAAVERFEGAVASRHARAWLESDAELQVLRDSTGSAVGFACYIDLPSSAAAVIRDPIVDAFSAVLSANHRLREHERATLCRWFLSVDAYQAPDEVQAQLFIHMSGRLAFSPGVALGASVHRDPEVWLHRPDRTHDLLARLHAWGGEWGVFGTDWRREPPWAWFERIMNRLSGMPSGGPVPAEVVLLERNAFSREVKRVLRHLHDPDELGRSPLLWAPLVRRRYGIGPTEQLSAALGEVVVEACDRLSRHVGQSEAAALLRVAFVDQPRRKQLAIASELGMGFSTYRRHLGRAIELLVTLLWEAELASG